MNFTQVEFLGFMAIVFSAYWLVGSRKAQNMILLVASAVFYGWVHPWFLILLYFSATLDFAVGWAMVKWPGNKKHFLGLSLLGNLGMLGYFKYFDFFVANVIGLLEGLGVHSNFHTLGIFLPVGISFYTFQTMSYTIDIYRGEAKPRKSFLDYAVYVSFFPQLVAGPIERAGRLLPQVERARIFQFDQVWSGFGLAMWGAFKKLVIADTIAPYVDKMFIVSDPAGPMIWAASAAFMIQIFADFSGYTDIARGTARMLGFDLIKNFRAPFIATSTPDFWRRWHISLSFWIRDYVMAPLLGDKDQIPMFRFIWVSMLTFVLIGVWHGASWNFVLFGVFHGFWMAAYGIASRNIPKWAQTLRYGKHLAIVFHLLAVNVVGSMLFREHSLSRILHHVTTPPLVATQDEWIATAIIVGVTFVFTLPMVIAWGLEETVLPKWRQSRWYPALQTSMWTVFAFAMFVFYRVSAYDFIYFQF